MNEPTFSHLVENKPGLVDISEKKATFRRAVAKARMSAPSELIKRLGQGIPLNQKGPVFETAIIAGTMAVKNTSSLIPLCHNIALSSIKFEIEIKEERIYIQCEVKTLAPTGVEMEALTGVSIAALTIYDMCKSFSSDIVIKTIYLQEKTGGKHDIKYRS